MNKIANTIRKILSSNRFYYFLIGFFVFESVWIALTAAYPQAFDENFHFGLIKFYSTHWSPFIVHQNQSANIFGAVTRDPSYLYHYLMSFYYGFIALFVHRETYQIIAIRLLDIAFFTIGIILFTKVLNKMNLSKGLVNLTLLIFILIPIVPQLAGQINYDDLLFPLVAISTLLSINLRDEILLKKPKFSTISLLLITCLVASLVKFAFLPIFLGIFVYFSVLLYKNKDSKKKLQNYLFLDFKKSKLIIKITLIGLLIILCGMFMERDMLNIVKYHAIVPDCSKVLSVKQCSAYYVWSSDYSRHQAVIATGVHASKNIFYFGLQWVYWMWYRLFFAVNGPFSDYTNFPPLPLPTATAGLLSIVGLILFIKFRKVFIKLNKYNTLIFTICAFYIVALFVEGYQTYQFTAFLENMNGRYLIPVLLLMLGLVAQLFTKALSKYPNKRVLLGTIILILFMQGGGILTFIDRSDDSWDWQNKKVISVNNAARKITQPFVISGQRYYQTKFWFFN